MTVQGSLEAIGDIHAAASGQDEDWMDSLRSGVQAVPQWLQTSVISGSIGLYNTGVAVTNVLGGNVEEANTSDVIASYDDNLSSYYERNKGLVDTSGFIMGSIIPGIAGVKGLQFGQAALRASSMGRLGAMGVSLSGVLAPDVATYSYAARAAIAAGTDGFSLLNGAVLKAIGSNYLQNTLEAAAFETAATLAQGKSEILKDKEVSGLVGDMAKNALFGGALGGTFSSIGTFFGVKQAVKAVDSVSAGLFTRLERVGVTEGTKATDIVDRMLKVPDAPTAEDILLGKVPGLSKSFPPLEDVSLASKVQTDAATDLAAKYARDRATFLRESANDWRTSVTAMSGGDGELSKVLSGQVLASGTDANFLLNAQKLTRMGEADIITQAAKKRGDFQSYIQLFGEGAGNLHIDPPSTWRVADKFSKPEEVEKFLVRNKVANADSFNVAAFDKYSELDADARYLLAERLKTFDSSTPIHEMDLPMLKAAWRLQSDVTLLDDAGRMYTVSAADVEHHIAAVVDDAIQQAAKNPALDVASVAHKLDVPRWYIEGTRRNGFSDMFASQQDGAAYTNSLKKAGIIGENAENVRVRELPKWAVVHNTPADVGPTIMDTPFSVDAAASVAERVKLARELADRTVRSTFPEFQKYFNSMPDSLHVARANRLGAGPGFASFSGASYTSLASQVEHVGAMTHWMRQEASEAVSKVVAPYLAKLEANPVLAAEFGAIDNLARRAGEPYIMAKWIGADGKDASGMVLRSVWEAGQKLAKQAGNEFAPTADDLANLAQRFQPRRAGTAVTIPFRAPELEEIVGQHISATAASLQRQIGIDAARGIDSGARWGDKMQDFYAPPAKPEDYPYYAFVKDHSLGAGANGSVSMIHAADEKTLQALIDRVPNQPQLEVYTGEAAKRYYKSIGKFEYEQTFHDSRVNNLLDNAGIASEYFTQTSGTKLSQQYMQFHTERAANQVRAAVAAKYADEVETLRNMGESATDVARSKKGFTGMKGAEGAVANPYEDYIKQMLDISKFSESGVWYAADQLINNSAKRVMTALGIAANSAKSAADYQAVTDTLAKYGLQTAYKDAASYAFANHMAGKAPITSFIRTVNGILADGTLRLDPLNGVVNALGGSMSRSSELNFLLRAIRNQNSEVAGTLSDLVTTDIGAGIRKFSPAKLQAEALQQFAYMDKAHPWYQEFVNNNWLTDATRAQHELLDMATLTGNESASTLLQMQNALVSKAAQLRDLGATVTGNNLAERMNRFMSAYCAKKITSLAVDAGVLAPSEEGAFINTFINRTEGTLVASQRPVLFNGAIGSAIGLFQSYQFRIMQQLMRFVGEGTAKDTAYALGMQGTLFGANGLPGFAWINQHIIGTQSTNPQHRDAYDAVYGVAGRSLGDLVTYGLPSNILQTALYSRGDINPRSPVLVPVSPADVPAVSMMTKIGTAIKMMIDEGAQTGNLGHALLTGLEHNGVNRPLAGISQLAQGLLYSKDGQTVVAHTSNGTPMMQSQLYDITQLARLAGSRPLREGVAMDAYYRAQAFSRADLEARQKLATLVRDEAAAGTLTNERMQGYLSGFMQTGKTQAEFAPWIVNVMRQVDGTESQKITNMLKSPYGYKMQEVMGGQYASRTGVAP